MPARARRVEKHDIAAAAPIWQPQNHPDTIEALLLRRVNAPDKIYGGGWNFPAGHIEKGESPRHAAAREMNEETRIKLDESKLIFLVRTDFEVDDEHLRLHLFMVIMGMDKRPIVKKNKEHTEFKWVELEKLPAHLYDPDRMNLDKSLAKDIARRLEVILYSNRLVNVLSAPPQ
jgi:8-oxo-dGTP diphosphatase